MNILISILIYLLISVSLIISKPRIFIDNENNLKSFGTGQEKTIFPLWFALMIFAVFSYLFVEFHYK
jgi:hypothetical protein